jgi:hypothetical protein
MWSLARVCGRWGCRFEGGSWEEGIFWVAL